MIHLLLLLAGWLICCVLLLLLLVCLCASRCQVLLDDASPEMKGKMISTLLYVHGAWAKAGL
jgi:hypothetical protein